MAAVAHGWQPSSGRKVNPAVAKEFHNADVKAGHFEHKKLPNKDKTTVSAKIGNQSTDAYNSY